jgi:hypothetical protein
MYSLEFIAASPLLGLLDRFGSGTSDGSISHRQSNGRANKKSRSLLGSGAVTTQMDWKDSLLG